MVQTKTFIIMIICFIVTLYFTEKYFMKHEAKIGLLKILLGSITILALLTIIVSFVPMIFPLLIYVSMVIATFVCTYSRHRFAYRKEC